MEYNPTLIVFIFTLVITCVLLINWPKKQIVTCDNKNDNPNRKLILISLDGFRWDYLHGRGQTPTFDSMKRKGVWAEKGMVNGFISNTLPNHFTLVTGLYPESHGMLDNTIHDQETDTTYMPHFYDHDAQNDPSWYSGIEPIWVANQLQRKGGRSGVLMWMGGEHPINGVVPHRFILHTYHMDEMVEVDHLADWLTDEKEPVNLAVVYFPEPDKTSHLYGPDAVEVTKKIEYLDKAMQRLLNRLDAAGLTPDTDVIILADHGFTSVSKEKIIPLDDILDRKWYTTYTVMPAGALSLFPNEGYLDLVYTKLQKAADDSGGLFTVYKSRDIPERFHLKNHRNVPPILALANLNYSFVTTDDMATFDTFHGNHGYDNANSLMHPIFMAFGPSFKQNQIVEGVRNTDVYPLMCRILGIEPQPNNGSMETVAKLLRDDAQCHDVPTMNHGILRWELMALFGVAGFAIYVTLQHRKDKQRLKTK